MEEKTPKFNFVIKEIMDSLSPHKRTCKWKGVHQYCQGEFEIEGGDIKFLKIFSVPPPNFCPTCRRIRRLAHFGVSQLFKRKCDAPKHNETMISLFSDQCPFPVYDYSYFISDEFDPFYFGVEYKKNPMETLFGIRRKFPMPSFLNRDPSSINSEYSSGGRNLKNGYYVSSCFNVENAWYSGMLLRSRDVMDSLRTDRSEFVYEGFFSDHVYNSSFVYFSSGCIDSMFIFDCRNCQKCFGCVNLINVKYCIYNKQHTEEEYMEFMSSVYPLTRDKLSSFEDDFWNLIRSLPVNGTRNVASDNVFGTDIRNSKNLFDVSGADNSENIRHADGALSHHDSMDFLYSGGNSSFLYMDTNIGSQSSRVKFSVSTKFSTDCEFVFNSKNLSNCFMCFGLQNKSYCILNKQYTENDYFKIMDVIKTEMLEKGEYADGPGIEFSAMAYNFSLAQVVYPLNETTIEKLGGYVAKEPETNAGNIQVIKYDDLPEMIDDIKDSLTDGAVECEKTGRPFRITLSELGFYRKMKLPIPAEHPSVRINRRLKFSGDGMKFQTKCEKCKKEIETMFSPERKLRIFCEKCFQMEVS